MPDISYVDELRAMRVEIPPGTRIKWRSDRNTYYFGRSEPDDGAWRYMMYASEMEASKTFCPGELRGSTAYITDISYIDGLPLGAYLKSIGVNIVEPTQTNNHKIGDRVVVISHVSGFERGSEWIVTGHYIEDFEEVWSNTKDLFNGWIGPSSTLLVAESVNRIDCKKIHDSKVEGVVHV